MESTITSEKSKMDALKVEIGGLEEEKKALETEIKELDEAMASATATREKEKTEFTKVMSELSISSSLLMKAKEVMEKVYAPKKDEPALIQDSSSAWESSLSSFLGDRPATTSLSQQQPAGMGIINLLDKLNSDIKMQQQEEEMTESQSQKDYDEVAMRTKESR